MASPENNSPDSVNYRDSENSLPPDLVCSIPESGMVEAVTQGVNYPTRVERAYWLWREQNVVNTVRESSLVCDWSD